ncbi:hypothetical protein L798_09076 [Zootermopsis nevadensis]|uniref:Transmembrane protein 214 n=1 Tax=Zootermopsis nevadensis TaxID=136037 RepID=A0A067RAK0_ZOONE|nr:hypothetical protein L798_09076 [Zootermopsis nevadensis]
MSGQWEVVGKNKQKQSGQTLKRLSKSERKKFVENAPKVEDILPLAEVKTLYTTLDNDKENHKPSGKETNLRENEAKKAQKKQPVKKKEVKEKPPTPKSLEMAVRLIDVDELANELEIGQARFQDAPLMWLKGLAEYLNVKLEHSNPVLNPKAIDYPLCVLSGEIRDVLRRAFKDAGEAAVQHFFHICLTAMADDMIRGSSLIYGYKIMLQLLAYQNPSITVSNIQKVTALRNSYQNRQPIGLAILWALGQGGTKDIQIGLKVWLDVMVPVMDMRNYTSFVVNYLKDILTHSPQGRPVNHEQFFAVLDVIHSPTSNLPNDIRQKLLSLIPSLRVYPEKRLRNFFEPLLLRLEPSASGTLKEELLMCLVMCLNSDQHCYSTWRQLYTKHLPQSAILLAHIDSHWGAIKEHVVKMLSETLSTFQVTNEELRKDKHKDEQHLTLCQHSCGELLKKMTVSRTFPWKLGSFLLLLAIAGLLSYDIRKHGSFHSSSSGRFLNDIGALQYGEHAWAKTKFYSDKSFRWAEANIPLYCKIAGDHARPYLELAWDVCLVVGHQLHTMYENVHAYVEEKTPAVIKFINHYAPGLLDKVKVHSIEAWELAKQSALILRQFFLRYSYIGLEWFKTNVFVGNLSPENLQKYSMEALNTTQVYAVWTYDWVCQKVQTLSKVQ